MSIRKHGSATGRVTQVEGQPGIAKTADKDWSAEDEADLMAETDEE